MAEERKLEPNKGLFFDEFQTGQVLTSMERTVTEADVVAFAELSGDMTPIHTDAEFAARHPFGQRVAHGLLGASIASGLAMGMGFLDDTILAFREIKDWKFSLPIYLGDTVRVRITIGKTHPVPRLMGGLVSFHVELLNQHDRAVQRGEWSVLIKNRSEQPAG